MFVVLRPIKKATEVAFSGWFFDKAFPTSQAQFLRLQVQIVRRLTRLQLA
jgi:hypothetical protein